MLKSKRILALVLSMIMLLSLMPMTVMAEDSTDIYFGVDTPADIYIAEGPNPGVYAYFETDEAGKYIVTVDSPADIAICVYKEGKSGDVFFVNTCTSYSHTLSLDANTRYYAQVYPPNYVEEAYVVALYLSKIPNVDELSISEMPYDTSCVDTYLSEYFPYGIVLEGNMSDGGTEYFSFDGYNENYEIDFTVDTDPDSETYGRVTFTVGGASTYFDLEIIKNPVKSLKYKGKPIEITENTYTEVMYDDEEQPFKLYNIDSVIWEKDIELEVKTAEGKTETHAISSDFFYDCGINIVSYQYEEHWTEGNTYYVTLDCCGIMTDVPVKVVKSNVKSIKIDKAPSYVYTYYDYLDGYDYGGEYVFWPENIDDLKFTVTYKDGTKRSFTGEDIDMRRERLEGEYCAINYDTMNAVPGKHPVTLNYGGAEATYNVTLKDAGVKSVKLTKEPAVKDYDDYYRPTFAGAEVTITYNNGSKKVVKVTNDNIYMEYSDLYVYDETDRPIIRFVENYDDETGESWYEVGCFDKSSKIGCMNYVENEYQSISIKNPNLNFKNMKISVKKDGNTTTYDLSDDITQFGGGFGGEGMIPHVFHTLTDKGIINVTVIGTVELGVPKAYYASAFGCEWNKEVNEVVELKGISVSRSPDKIRYKKGETFDPSGLELSLDYGTVKGKATYDNDEITVSKVDTSTQGKKKVTVSFEGKKTTFEIEVAEGFNDVKKTAWYSEYTEYAAQYGLLQGTGNGNFSPETYLTRAQFVQILANIEGIDTSNSNIASGYKDVAKGKWYTVAVKWASDNGIVAGVGDGKFAPDAKITREQMCVMLRNYVEKYLNTEFMKKEAKLSFKDDAKISDWAKDAVKKCQMADIVNGVGESKFAPQDYAKRSEGATLFAKFHQENPYY
ncbi:MAG: S-layer homology domain-containing protein [Clostridia bacterium]|nr:S-layer homology domain-containing protein [Clostridia bacterium]